MLEVLISLFLLSIVMLGVAAVSVKTLHESRALYYFQQAEWQAQGMAEFARAAYGNPDKYLREWQSQLKLLLPEAVGDVVCTRFRCLVSVSWGGYSGLCRQQIIGVSGCVFVVTHM